MFPISTNIFQMGWNHQLVDVFFRLGRDWYGVTFRINATGQKYNEEATLSYQFLSFHISLTKRSCFMLEPPTPSKRRCQLVNHPLFFLVARVHGGISAHDLTNFQVVCLWASQQMRGSSHCFTTRHARGDHRAMGLGPLKPAGERPDPTGTPKIEYRYPQTNEQLAAWYF